MSAEILAAKTTGTTTVHAPVTKQQAIEKCKEYTKNELAASVIASKYLLCDENNNYVEICLEDMWCRMAKAIVQPEKPELREEFEKRFVELLRDFKFVPAGRIMYGLGNRFVNVTLKNCYVIAIEEDSVKGIFDMAYRAAETYKAGGGVGSDISVLRPKGSPVHNAARYSSGSISFMDFFSRITGLIGQKARIGAMLLSMDVSHPDIIDFIEIKSKNNDDIRFANISVKITDEFMKAVEADKDFDLKFNGKVYKTVKAREIWDKIIECAWKRGEPGLLFWDKIISEIPAQNYPGFQTVTTNPCGETTLSHGDSCNLGSMNLSKYVIKPYTKEASFDFPSFDIDVRLAVRFLDNIISMEKTPLPFQQQANDNGKRLGLGIMGLADVFLKMGMRYDSDEALAVTNKIMSNFMISSYDASCDLAKEKGSFPVFNAETHFKSEYVKRLPVWLQNKITNTGIRNIAIHAIAPTGSLAIVAQCSSGIEPVFQIKYIRKTNLGTAKEVVEHEVLHSVAQEYVDYHGVSIDKLPPYFIGAYDVKPESRIRLQAAIQKYIDQSISNTFNMAKGTPKEQIGYYYTEAWKSGLKGITVYREGSREGVLVSADSKKEENREQNVIMIHQAPKRPDSIKCKVHSVKPNGKKYTVFVGFLGDRVYEVFALDHGLAGVSDGMEGEIKKAKGDNNESQYYFESGCLIVKYLNRYEDKEASLVTRLISTALRHGTPLEFICDQITKAHVPVTSLSRAIARALSCYIKEEETKGKFKCSACGSKNIKFEGTCYVCLDCGSSKCG